MTRPNNGPSDRRFHLVITNFGGGKEPSNGVDRTRKDGVRELAGLVRSLPEREVVLSVQEMTAAEPTLSVRVAHLEQEIPDLVSSFVPRMNTAWYPLAAKWHRTEGPTAPERRTLAEGLCTASSGLSFRLGRWANLSAGSWGASLTRVLDLPVLQFRSDEDPHAGGWLTTGYEFRGVCAQLSFRPTYYQGNRDSDPRIAQVCVLEELCDDGFSPFAILINLHLSTRREEYGLTSRRQRTPTASASFQRLLQLQLVARFIHEIIGEHGLPVIVAGDFNAEPDAPEMAAFSQLVDAEPALGPRVCWKCQTVQVPRPELPIASLPNQELALYVLRGGEDPAHVIFSTDKICSNDFCREPRFTHKRNIGLVDNVYICHPPGTRNVKVAGPIRVLPGLSYSDHAAVVVPLTLQGM